jgi:hypothetical protein
MTGAISEALALVEIPNTLTKARAATETEETTRFEKLFEDWLVI